MYIGKLRLLRPDPLMSPYVTIRLAYPLLYVQLLCTCAVYLFVVLFGSLPLLLRSA